MSDPQGHTLEFKHISVKAEKRFILKDVSGKAQPGELMAIMGPSGAGKTTLLNCLAGRKNVDKGVITMNSKVIDKQLRRRVSYVLQQDIFLPNLTCWQTIWFTALLRLPGSMATKEKKKRAYEIIDALDMRKCLNTVVGDESHRGLSGGERRRTTIACDLLTNPSTLMLDEPTSGLDSSTAFSLCSALKSYAKISGKTVIITIHQPSSQIFNMFDTLLLLCEGQVAFYGDISHCSEYFSKMELPCPPNYNLADHILDQAKGSEETQSFLVQTASTELRKTVLNEALVPPAANEMFSDGENEKLEYQVEYNSKWPTSFWLQYSVLARRQLYQTWPAVVSKWSIAQVLIISIAASAIWFNIGTEEENINSRVSVSYFIAIHASFEVLLNLAATFSEQRAVMSKERLAGYYRLSTYYLAKISVDMVLYLVMPLILTIILFWTAFLNADFLTFAKYFLAVIVYIFAAASLGQLFSAAVIKAQVAVIAANSVMLVSLMSSGFFIRHLPYWASWIKYLSFMGYGASMLVGIDLSHINIRCSETESRFSSCTNSSAYHESFLPFVSKSELIDEYTLAGYGLQVWHYGIALVVMAILVHVINYLILRYVRKPKLA